MLGVIKALTDVCNYVKELKEYYGLKNKTLFEGNWTTASQTKTILNIDKYDSLMVYPWDKYSGVLLQKINSTTFSGEGMIEGVTTVGVHTSVGIRLNFNSNKVVTIAAWNGLRHQPSSNHSATIPLAIVKIVGVDPIIPQTLTKLGGHKLAHFFGLRRWVYA